MAKYFAHESAIIGDNALVGDDTKIWHFSHVMAGAQIGSNCVLGQNVYVGSKALIGNGVKIQNNVSVYDRVVLEDDVFVGPSAVFTNVFNPRSFVNRREEYRETRIRRGATLGANSTVVCGVNVGQYALIGAGCVVTRDIPDFGLVYGVSGKLMGWVCKCGVKLPDQKGHVSCAECGCEYTLSPDTCEPVGEM